MSLAPVRVERARIIGTTVGLRPFRPDGFVVRAVQQDGKLLVHHYGHGGCGISLSWGTARMVLDEVLRAAPDGAKPARAAVIGSGAVGLATARVLQDHGIAVTVYTAATATRTTSSVAGAFWAPFSLVGVEQIAPEFVARLAEAGRTAHRTFTELAGDERYGVRRLPLYYLDDHPPVLSAEMAATPELFEGPLLAPGEHPFGERFALQLEGMAIEPALYLTALLDDFLRRGGRIVRREFTSAHDLAALDEALVINCAGLGARALANDATLSPLKGQLVLLTPQPEIDYMLVAPRQGLYMLPRRDAIVLGTSHQRDCWSLLPDAGETTRILDGHRALFSGVARFAGSGCR